MEYIVLVVINSQARREIGRYTTEQQAYRVATAWRQLHPEHVVIVKASD